MGNKGISTVIAVLLMLIIVIAILGLFYGYVSTVLTSKTATSFSIVDTFSDTITIRNDGTQSIDSFSRVTVDGNPATYLVTAQDSSLVGYWKFDEATGTTAVDSSGNGNTGTLLPAGSEPKWTSKYGSALIFDGINDYVEVVDSPSINVQNFTIAVWLKAKTTQMSVARIVTDLHWASGVDHGYILRMIDGKPEIALEGGFGKTRGFTRAATDVRNNNWYFVVATHQPNNTRIYINGVLEDTNTFISDPPNTTTTNTHIGGSGATQPFNGTIDEVKLYNRALSADEINAVYNIGSQIKGGQGAIIKIYNALSVGTHTVRICTTSMCNTAYLAIS